MEQIIRNWGFLGRLLFRHKLSPKTAGMHPTVGGSFEPTSGTRSSGRRWVITNCKAVGCLSFAVAFACPSMGATFSLSVNLSDSIRPVTHCASGSLYGITETLPSDIPGMVGALHPNEFRCPALDGAGHQHDIGAAIPVSARIASTTGKVQFLLSDVYPNWPYQFAGISDYKSQVTSVINAKIASGRTNYDGYEIWNEPNGTWQTANGDFNSTLWKPMYTLIRSLDPTAKIIGPSYSYYDNGSMQTFLTYCKANNCLPDVICWHQWGSDGFAGAYKSYRALEKSLGIGPLPISINEYSSNTHTYEGCPGVSVPFIAKFERDGVESAMISWWFTAYPGRLGSLLTSGNAKGGGWYLYKRYGDMTGYKAMTTPPNDASDGVDAFASVDRSQQYASIVLGGNSVGTVDVAVGGIPAWFGSSVDVELDDVTWTDKDTPVSGTTTLSTTKYAVTNGSITVPVNVTSQLNGYRLYVTPAATGILGQRTAANAGSGSYRIRDLQGRDLGLVKIETGENLEAAVARIVPRPGIYVVRPNASEGIARKILVGAK